MENNLKPFTDMAEFQKLITSILVTQIIFDCEVMALKKVMQMIISSQHHYTFDLLDSSYRDMMKMLVEKKIELGAAYSPEMTAMIRSDLNKISGLNTEDLK